MERAEGAFYRSADPIEHLLLRLSIRTRQRGGSGAAFSTGGAVPLPSTGLVPLGTTTALAGVPTAAPAAPPPHAALDAGADDERVFEFAWQQKVLGPRYVHVAWFLACACEQVGGWLQFFRFPFLRFTSSKFGAAPCCFVDNTPACRELLKCAAAVADKAAGRYKASAYTPTEADYINEVERRLAAGEPVFEPGPSDLLVFTYVDRYALCHSWLYRLHDHQRFLGVQLLTPRTHAATQQTFLSPIGQRWLHPAGRASSRAHHIVLRRGRRHRGGSGERR